MEIFHCAGPVDLEVPMYDGPCDGADRPKKTQVIVFSSNDTCAVILILNHLDLQEGIGSMGDGC